MDTSLGLGANLTKTREAMRLSVKEVAERLRIHPKHITSLESEDFSASTPDIFLRGYLRSYGKLLNFSDADLATLASKLDGLVPKNTKPSFSTIKPIEKSKSDVYLRWGTYVIVLTMMGLVIAWFQSRPISNPANTTKATEVKTTEPKTTEPANIAPPSPSEPTTATPPVADMTPPTIISPPTTLPSSVLPSTIQPPADSSTPVQTEATLPTPATLKPNDEAPHLKMVTPEEPGLDFSDNEE